MSFYDQCTEHPEHGWMVPLRVWAPFYGLTPDELQADYDAQMAEHGVFRLRKEWVRYGKELVARYGTEDLDVIYDGEVGR